MVDLEKYRDFGTVFWSLKCKVEFIVAEDQARLVDGGWAGRELTS